MYAFIQPYNNEAYSANEYAIKKNLPRSKITMNRRPAGTNRSQILIGVFIETEA